MGRIAQLSGNAHPSLQEALISKKVSVNRGWKILKAVQQLSQEEQESVAVEMQSAVWEINQLDAESEYRHKISAYRWTCKAKTKKFAETVREEARRSEGT